MIVLTNSLVSICKREVGNQEQTRCIRHTNTILFMEFLIVYNYDQRFLHKSLKI